MRLGEEDRVEYKRWLGLTNSFRQTQMTASSVEYQIAEKRIKHRFVQRDALLYR